MENFADLYTDYLICSSSYTTAIGMASLLSIKYDKITRHLSKGLFDSKFLWSYCKPYIKELTQSKEMVVLSFDDSIEEKQYTDSSELVCWHYDHVFKRSVKGVNFLTALVELNGMRLPCAVEPIAIKDFIAVIYFSHLNLKSSLKSKSHGILGLMPSFSSICGRFW